MRKGLSCCSRAAAAAALLLLLMPAAAAEAQEITYTFSGVIRVLDLSSPAPGDGPGVPGADPLGLDGSAVLLVCAIDSATAPSFSGPNGDGAFAFYNAGIATLAITGSSGGVDGTYVDMPCSVRVDDFPVGSSFGGDKLSLTTTWDLGLPFPDVFQVPFAELGQDTFTGIDLQPFAATDVVRFVGVNFSGSSDVFYFDSGTGIANGLTPPPSPALRIAALIDAVDALPDLRRGPKVALIVKLVLAADFLEAGEEGAAATMLRIFARQVQRFIDRGFLTPEEGQPLVDEANAITDQIEAG